MDVREELYLKSIAERIVLLDDECQNPEYAADSESILRIIGDIAKKGRKVLKIKKEPPPPPRNETGGYIPTSDRERVYGGPSPYRNTKRY